MVVSGGRVVEKCENGKMVLQDEVEWVEEVAVRWVGFGRLKWSWVKVKVWRR